MSWNIGFARNLILKLHNNLEFFHIVLEEKISHFERILHNGRRKIHIRYRSDIKKTELIEYRRNGNQWKNNQSLQLQREKMISYSIYFLHY